MLRRCSRRLVLHVYWGRIAQGFDASSDKPRPWCVREIVRFRWAFLRFAAELTLQLL
jgi:hypothetical protein